MHGHNNVIGVTLFPHNIELATSNNPQLIDKSRPLRQKKLRSPGLIGYLLPPLPLRTMTVEEEPMRVTQKTLKSLRHTAVP